MAKKSGYEVVATKPVCVDFRDGRTISFRPGQRFEATATNTSVLRLLRVNEVRKLSKFEPVAPMPVKLGAPRRVQNVLKARAQVAAARKAAAARLEASRRAPPKIEVAKPAPKPAPKPALKPRPARVKTSEENS